MSETRVVHVDDMPRHPDAVYIGREMPPSKKRPRLASSPFANPFKIGDRVHGTTLQMTRADMIAAYRSKLTAWPNELLAMLPELRGKPLACWCRHDGEARTEANACHGDVLVELLETFTDDELRALAKGAT